MLHKCYSLNHPILDSSYIHGSCKDSARCVNTEMLVSLLNVERIEILRGFRYATFPPVSFKRQEVTNNEELC